MGNFRNFHIDEILRVIIWKTEIGFIYINKDFFLWKKDNTLMPKGKNDIPDVKKYPVKFLEKFNPLTKLEEEFYWADWWVWRYFFKEDISNRLEVVSEDFGFTDEFSKKIGYNSSNYSTEGVRVIKENCSITFIYSKSDAYKVYRLIDYFVTFNARTDFIGLNTKTDLKDGIDFFRFIKKNKKITIILEKNDFLLIKDIKIYFKK